MKQFVLTTIAGVESIAKKEIEKQGGEIIEVKDRMILFSGDDTTMVRVNLWSRVANKVYLLAGRKDKVLNFDDYYNFLLTLDWKSLIPKDFSIYVKAKSIRSHLESENSLQKIAKKAVVDTIAGKGQYLEEDEKKGSIGIKLLCLEDTVYVMINTTGEALHKRGYREQAGEAPLKENLAAALVLLSGWNFKAPFYDLFCGSGTIAIEAAMIAKNIAPGLQRSFAFEDWGTELKTLKSEGSKLAKKEQYDGKYTILAGDNDEKVLDIARHNAFKAGVEDMITFMQRDYRDFAKAQLVGTMVSNPPYGMRLRPENLRQMYVDLNRLFQENEQLTGGIITSFEGNDMIMQAKNYKKRKLYNGGERCYFYKKK